MHIKKMHASATAAEAAAIDKTINAMIEKAVVRNATDIHVEPRDRNIVVRFRIDGWLHEIAKLPLRALPGLVKNLKERADLDPNETHAPQSGSFQFDSAQLDTALAIATMPTMTGEKIVMHITPRLSEPATLESLGYWGLMLAHIEHAVAEPHGLVIATSPNKTGTSMSLLGVAHLLNNPALNITTLEDPIERRVAGLNQTQVNAAAGIDFSTGLQALLKQDPNVVMISDMHRPDTVAVAVQASLSGHLILGGLHTDSAAHGVAHLLHMGSEPFLVATALKVALGQRFVRRLCPACRQAYKPDEPIRKDLKRFLKVCGISSVKQLHELELQAAESGIGSEHSSLSSSETGIMRLWQAHPDGCAHCRFNGYVGQVGICEVLVNSDAMKKLLVGNKASASAIQKLAIGEGMVPLQLDGLIKALRGLTALEDILPLLSTMPVTAP